MWTRTLVAIASCMLALLLIIAAGFYGWTEVISAYFGHSGSYSLPILLGFGILAGALSFFAPCAFVLFPGYVSYFLAQTEKRAGTQHRILHSISIGSACGLGSVIFFLLLGTGVSLVGISFSQYLIKVKPLIALFFLVLGILLVANISLDLSPIRNRIPIRFSKNQDGSTTPLGSFFLYGFGYGLATTGCTFPIFVSLIIAPITSGRFLTGLLPFVSFALAMGLLMTVVTVLIGLSKDILVKWLMASTEWIKRISGVFLILAALYMGYFFILTGM
jgi:cytochrome c-type biogenesis protein